MLKKENRLTVFSMPSAKIISTPLFNLKIIKNNSEISRFGFIVSKKVSTSAVVRNAAKRKIRSLIEEKLMHLENGFDLAFYLKKDIISVNRTEVDAMLIDILKKEKLLHV